MTFTHSKIKKKQLLLSLEGGVTSWNNWKNYKYFRGTDYWFPLILFTVLCFTHVVPAVNLLLIPCDLSSNEFSIIIDQSGLYTAGGYVPLSHSSSSAQRNDPVCCLTRGRGQGHREHNFKVIKLS